MHLSHSLTSAILLVVTHSQPPGDMPPGDSGATTTSAGLCNIDAGDDSTYIETLESDSSAYNGYVRHIQMTGCPNYQTEGVYYDYDATIMNRDIEIPAYPCFSDADYDLICSGGTIAVTLNGVAVFSRMQGGECDVDDDSVDNNAVENEHDDFDECGGHPSDFGEYHYHIAPSCLLDQMGENDNVTAHSPLIGWAYDGFPVYGPYSVGGVEMYPCNHTYASSEYCLDDCGGTSQYEIDGFLYHYHLQGPLSDLVSRPTSPYPGEDRSPYTIGCFKGVPIETNTGGSCVSDGFTSDYVPAVTDGVTEVYCTASDISTCNSNATTETPSTTTTDGSGTSESTSDSTTTPSPSATTTLSPSATTTLSPSATTTPSPLIGSTADPTIDSTILVVESTNESGDFNGTDIDTDVDTDRSAAQSVGYMGISTICGVLFHGFRML